MYNQLNQITMNKQFIKAVKEHIKTLREFQDELFERGHTFWYCDAQDNTHNKPFYYFQINRTQHMATCSTCHQLIENRKKIRKLQKSIGIEQDLLYTNYSEEEHVKRVSVNSIHGCNHDYLSQ